MSDKVNVLPQAGDTLVIDLMLTGFDRKGNKVIRKARKSVTEISAVYLGGRVSVASGDTFEVKLLSPATDEARAVFITTE